MSNQYALVENGVVVNVILWDGNTATWAAPEGQQAVAIPDGEHVAIGWTWDGKTFEAP